MISQVQPETIAPPVDIIKRPTEWVVLVDLPGADEQRIEVSTARHQLTLTAPVAAQEPEGVTALYRGYEPHAYRRVFTLSEDVDQERITAVYKNGVLRLTLPQTEQARPRQIGVRVEH